MPVRVFHRFAQVGGDGGFQPGRDRMLERFRLDIDLAPVQTQDAGEKQFDQSVAANDAAGFGDSRGRSACARARFVCDVTFLREAFEHSGHRRGAHTQGRGDFVGRNKPFGCRRGRGSPSDNPGRPR